MIPSITPPTDNLYKFVSLFGLTIFLFSIYNLDMVYDRSSRSKMKIEDIKTAIQKEIFEREQSLESAFSSDTNETRFRPAKIKNLDEDLQKIQSVIYQTDLTELEKITLTGQVRKLKVEVSSLSVKLWTSFGVTAFGVVIMIYGFLRWFKREQKLRDHILAIEHALKEREQVELESKAFKNTTINVEDIVSRQ